MYHCFPVDTRRRFNVDTTSYDVIRRRNDVEMTSCVYRVHYYCVLILQLWSFWSLNLKDSIIQVSKNSHPEVFCTEGFLKNFAKFIGKHLYQSLCLIKLQASACNSIKNENLALVFSYAFYEIFKIPFFIKHLRWLLLSFKLSSKMKHIKNLLDFLALIMKLFGTKSQAWASYFSSMTRYINFKQKLDWD